MGTKLVKIREMREALELDGLSPRQTDNLINKNRKDYLQSLRWLTNDGVKVDLDSKYYNHDTVINTD